MYPLRIENVPPEDLIPSEYNPRKWSQKTLEDVKKSIKKFGFTTPMLVNGAPNRKNILIGGHLRREAAIILKLKTVPVVYLTIPDINLEKELNLRSNQNQGEFDWEILKGFDISLLLEVGFGALDFEKMWGDTLGIEDDGFEAEEKVVKIKAPKAKLGDLYQLGPHRLLCGDSTKLENYKILLGDERVDMIYGDPPYNIGLDYCGGIGGNKNKYGSGIVDDKKTPDEYRDFLKKCMTNAKNFCKKDSHWFFWNDECKIGLVQGLFEEVGVKNQRVNVWVKGSHNPTPQIAFNKVIEMCMYGTLGSPYLDKGRTIYNEILNPEIDTGKRCLDDIADILNIWLTQRLPGNEMEHPTEKPPQLHERPLKRCTKVGDIVLDQFGGSGSSLIACEQLKRRAFLMELDPIFIDLIISRYETLTGNKAKKLN